MGLWDETLEAYGRPGVPEACLVLQDTFGQNTSLLLWAVWAETADPAILARAADVVICRRVPSAVVTALKPAFPGVADAARQDLREDVKAVELRAERVLMETLETLTPGGGGAHALAALEAASAAWGKPAPADALAALAAALS